MTPPSSSFPINIKKGRRKSRRNISKVYGEGRFTVEKKN
jgi:hypothetical protein